MAPGWLPQVSRGQAISTFKGCLAYTLVFALVFTRAFYRLNKYPITLSSMVIVSIAGQPGASAGACLDAGVMAYFGVLIGAVMFVILGHLGHAPVAQGFILAIHIYFMAVVKAQSMRFFGLSLLSILMAFNGIYTSALLGGKFSADYLKAYLEAYSWGFAIVFAANLFVLPTSAERELRVLMVDALEHMSTFTHLLAKTYAVEITQDERAVRDALNSSIRADYGFIQQKTTQVALEINWTRWSMADYRAMLARIRQMQQGLITSYSNLMVMEQYEPQSLEIIKEGLTGRATGKTFLKLRKGIDLAIADIVQELGVGGRTHRPIAPGEYSWEDFLEYSEPSSDNNLEAGEGGRPTLSERTTSVQSSAFNAGFRKISMRLKDEVEHYSSTPITSRRHSFHEEHTGKISPEHPNLNFDGTTEASTPNTATVINVKALDRAASIRHAWAAFKDHQNQHVADLLASGTLTDGILRVEQPGPSLRDAFFAIKPGTISDKEMMTTTAVRANRTDATQRKDGKTKATESDEKAEQLADGVTSATPAVDMGAAGVGSTGSPEQIAGTTVLRVLSFVFGMGQVLDELTALHEAVVPKNDASRPRKKIHMHLLERARLSSPVWKGIPFREALSKLTGVSYADEKVTLWQRVGQLEKLTRSPTSLYAFKTTCAVSIFAVFILAPSLRTFFIDYSLNGGLITIVVAMAPVLGQGIFTWVLQILGTGLGTLYGLLILRIFLHVGPHYFNPYGLTCLLALFALPLCWIIYTKPMFFTGSLLAMNAAGIAVITQYVYRDIPEDRRPEFDTPAFRAGKQLTALALALGIAWFWQIYILRTPARQTLRIKLSGITFALGTYATLFQMMTESLAPIRESEGYVPPPLEAVEAVQHELIRREGQIQAELLALMPLLRFSALEPAFGHKFDGATFSRIIRNHQIILDRLREARTAIGVEGFPKSIKDNFTTPLAPFRNQNKRFMKALFYLVGTSLATKNPLPHDLPTMLTAVKDLQHDALFNRYWFYLASMSMVSYRLEACEPDLAILLGSVEASPFVINERPAGGFH
ncbi:BQ2448_693 [Microbotryum intermedium]|uniref:BQ2448_693 protein n=1 Tax=Microbotryum intermedium TaxID=269621 RepID=A0A238F346_9BASI|nr:BQ2448_693 [Microbotryum intermedium]